MSVSPYGHTFTPHCVITRGRLSYLALEDLPPHVFPGRFLLPSEAPLKHLDLLLWLLPEGLSDLWPLPLRLQSCVPSFQSDPHPPPDIWVAHRWYNRTPFHQTLVKNDRRHFIQVIAVREID